MTEKELLEQYVKVRKHKEEVEEQLRNLNATVALAEKNLIDFMQEHEIESTSKYSEFGRFQLCKPKIRVSMTEGMEELAFNHLREMGEGDLIQNKIHWVSLSRVMGEKVEANEPLPECFNSYFQQNIKWEKP